MLVLMGTSGVQPKAIPRPHQTAEIVLQKGPTQLSLWSDLCPNGIMSYQYSASFKNETNKQWPEERSMATSGGKVEKL